MPSPPSNQEFHPLPDRDAWGAIRGFVYQVDVTLLRWLGLNEGEQLALECGEDVDRIRLGLNGGEELERILEQIKYREHNITLRSPEALEAIVSFYSQRDLNPETPLRFRFVSNSSPGQEKSPTPLPGASGIRIWNQLLAGQQSAKSKDMIEGIRSILRTATRPQAVSEERWQKCQVFLAESSTDGLFVFVRDFEWGLEAGDINDVQVQVRAGLVRSGRALPGTDAQRKHTHLFVYALRIMSRPGQKCLTASDLRDVLSDEAIASLDTKLLDQLERMRDLLLSRIDDIERAVQRVQPAVEENLLISREMLKATQRTADSVEEMRTELQPGRIGLNFLETLGLGKPLATLGLDPGTMDPPPLVLMATKREETIKVLIERLGGKAWCALHGGSGTGKTQLVRLAIAPLSAGNCRWFRLDGLNAEQASNRILCLLNSILRRRESDSFENWLINVCSSLGRGSSIVLDDLPASDRHDGLHELLAHLCETCDRTDTRLISMGHKPLAHSVRSLVLGALVRRACSSSSRCGNSRNFPSAWRASAVRDARIPKSRGDNLTATSGIGCGCRALSAVGRLELGCARF